MGRAGDDPALLSLCARDLARAFLRTSQPAFLLVLVPPPTLSRRSFNTERGIDSEHAKRRRKSADAFHPALLWVCRAVKHRLTARVVVTPWRG